MISTFGAEFSRTLAAAPKEINDNYEGTHALPVTFSEMPVAPPTPHLDVDPTPVKVSLKSIRNPKFQLEYTVPRTDTIFAIKERLISDSQGPLYDSQYKPASLKLLVKAKVIGDTRQLLELPSTDFTVMFVTASESIDVPVSPQVYWGAQIDGTKVHTTESLESGTPATSSQVKKPGLTESFWSDIEAVAQRYVENPSALVKQFKEASSKSDI